MHVFYIREREQMITHTGKMIKVNLGKEFMGVLCITLMFAIFLCLRLFPSSKLHTKNP